MHTPRGHMTGQARQDKKSVTLQGEISQFWTEYIGHSVLRRSNFLAVNFLEWPTRALTAMQKKTPVRVKDNLLTNTYSCNSL